MSPTISGNAPCGASGACVFSDPNCDILKCSVHEAEIMLYYAAHKGLDVKEHSLVISKLKGNLFGQAGAPSETATPEDIAEFHKTIGDLSRKISPVTIQSLKDSQFYPCEGDMCSFGDQNKKGARAKLVGRDTWWRNLYNHRKLVLAVGVGFLFLIYVTAICFIGLFIVKDYNAQMKKFTEIHVQTAPHEGAAPPHSKPAEESKGDQARDTSHKSLVYVELGAIIDERIEELKKWNDQWYCKWMRIIFIDPDRMQTDKKLKQMTDFPKWQRDMFEATAQRENANFILNLSFNYILLAVWGLMGAISYSSYRYFSDLSSYTYTKRGTNMLLLQVALGGLAGFVIGFFISPSELIPSANTVSQNILPTGDEPWRKPLLGSLMLAFLGGYSGLFVIVNRVLSAVFGTGKKTTDA